MRHAEDERLGYDPDRGSEEPTKEHLLAKGAEHRDDHDGQRGHAAREGTQGGVKLPRPREASDRDAGPHHEQAAERQAPERAIDVSRLGFQHEPGLGMEQGRAATPEADEQ